MLRRGSVAEDTGEDVDADEAGTACEDALTAVDVRAGVARLLAGRTVAEVGDR